MTMTAEARKNVARRNEWLAEVTHRGTAWESLAATHPGQRAPEGINHECPTCHAEAGIMCVSKSGMLLSGWASHAARSK